MQFQREIYAEWLRIIAAFTVVFQHTVTSAWYTVPVDSADFFYLNLLNSFSRFGVSVFIMISGAFMLSLKYPHPPQKIFKHNLPKIVLLIAFWVVFYGIINALNSDADFHELISTPLLILTHPQTHLWFLYVIAGLYVLTPALRVFTEHASRRMLLYVIVLFFAFGLLLPTISHLLSAFFHFPLYKNLEIRGLSNFVGYYLSGYYIATFGIPKLPRKLLYTAAFLSWAVAFLGASYVSELRDAPNEYFFGNFRPTTYLMAAGIFCFAREFFHDAQTKDALFLEISKAMLGVYLIHPLFIRGFYKMHFSLIEWNPLLSVPLVAATIFILSLVVILLVRRIPGVKNIF